MKQMKKKETKKRVKTGGKQLGYRKIDVRTLKKKIEDYYIECEERKVPLTFTGLALALGITRTTLLNYSKDEEYSEIVLEAKARVEKSMEEMLLSGKGSATGIIFALKNNYSWKDRQEVDVQGKMSIEEYLKENKPKL